jgi:hypothetical protein
MAGGRGVGALVAYGQAEMLLRRPVVLASRRFRGGGHWRWPLFNTIASCSNRMWRSVHAAAQRVQGGNVAALLLVVEALRGGNSHGVGGGRGPGRLSWRQHGGRVMRQRRRGERLVAGRHTGSANVCAAAQGPVAVRTYHRLATRPRGVQRATPEFLAPAAAGRLVVCPRPLTGAAPLAAGSVS